MLTEACRGKQLSGFLASPSLCIIGPFFNYYFSTVVWNLFSHDCIYLAQRQLSWSHLKSQSGLCCRSFPSTPTQSKAETLDSSESFCKPVSDRTEQWLLSAYKNALLMSEIRHLEGCAAVVDPSKCCLFSAVCHHNIKLLKSGLSAPRRGADNERLCAVLIWWHFRGRGFHSHRHTLMATLQSHPQTEWLWGVLRYRMRASLRPSVLVMERSVDSALLFHKPRAERTASTRWGTKSWGARSWLVRVHGVFIFTHCSLCTWLHKHRWASFLRWFGSSWSLHNKTWLAKCSVFFWKAYKHLHLRPHWFWPSSEMSSWKSSEWRSCWINLSFFHQCDLSFA